MADIGGYRMISLQGYDLQNESINCPISIYESLQLVDKPIMITGIVINGKSKAPIFVINNDNTIIIYNRVCTFEKGKITTKGVEE